MKIAFLTSGTINSSISYRPLAFARELVKMGHEVYIFAPRFDKYSRFKDENITEIDGVKIIRPLQIRTFSFEIGLIPYIISSILILLKLNPDVIHMYKANPITVFGLLLRFARNKKIVFDTDDLDSVVVKIEKSSPFKIMLTEMSEWIVKKYATSIITGSKYLKEEFSNIDKSRSVTHIPNGAEFLRINSLSTKKSLSNRLIFLGNINRTNILKPFFIAVKKLKDENTNIKAVVIGDGKYLSYFKRLAKKLSIEKNITFLGRIPQNELNNYIHVGDLGYSYMPNETTQKACSNMKVFQYMQFGAVPIVSNVGDLPYYVFNGKAGYIAKHSDLESLTEVLKKALIHKQERLEKINYALVYASRSFSWIVLANKLKRAYAT